MRAAQPGRPGRPVWLFSSEPLGTGAEDAKGRDLRSATEPREIPGFTKAIHPGGHHVFFGALDPAGLPWPSGRSGNCRAAPRNSPKGDFRDWAERSRTGRTASPAT